MTGDNQNTIVSFNTYNNPSPVSGNARESVLCACDRWECDFNEITDSLQPTDFHDMFTKLYLPGKMQQYNRCLYLDTDVVINSSAPDPFTTFPDSTKIYVVEDMQQPFISPEDKLSFKHTHLCTPWYDECRRILGVTLDKQHYIDHFFNAGMFLFSPTNHAYIFNKIIDSLSMIENHYKSIHQVEQALINYSFMYHLRDNLSYVSKKWNYIDPPLERQGMHGYIYHFTGWYYETYKQKIDSFIDWK